MWFCPPYGIGGKLNVVKQGGAFAGGKTPLTRYASLPPYFAGGTLQKALLTKKQCPLPVSTLPEPAWVGTPLYGLPVFW